MRARLARRLPALAVLLVAAVAVAAAAAMAPGGTVKSARTGKYGTLLVSASGMSLYHMTSEQPGSIKCTGACTKFWPPLLLTGTAKPTAGPGVDASKLGTIKRPDGHIQVTYNRLPLYRYAADQKPGDVKGQGVQGIWFAVTAAGKLAKATTSSGGGGGYGRS